jgi:hypothetical protein
VKVKFVRAIKTAPVKCKLRQEAVAVKTT